MINFNYKKYSTIELFETIESNGVTEIISSCTAVLISQNLLLSVAHNVGYFSHAKFIDSDSKEILIELKDYKTLTQELDEHFDLCLIKLPTLAPLNYRPIQILDENYEISNGAILQAAGYGIDGDDQEGKSQLRTFELPFHDLWSNHLRGKHTNNQRCSVGDSGGPAYLSVNESLYLAGVTTGTDENKEFSYFIRPNLFKNWIVSIALEFEAMLPIFVNPS
jgi:hypothetical protein